MTLNLITLSNCKEELFPDRSKEPVYIFDSFWHEVDRHYSLFENTKVDWDSVYKVYRTRVTNTTSSTKLFGIFDEILSLLNDAHTNVYAPIGTAGNIRYFSQFPVNPILANPSGPYFETFTDINPVMGYGKISNSTLGYVRIKKFQGEKSYFEAIDQVMEALHSCSGLIIDVRTNLGGSIANSELLASRFANEVTQAYDYRVRNGPKHSDFTPWYTVLLKPNSPKTWTKSVVVLTNRESYSATEWFVLFMDMQSMVTIVGDTTGGGLSVPITRELPNGWIIRISNTQTRRSSEEGVLRSVLPDVPVWISKEDQIKNIDTILEKAIELLK